MQPKYGVGYLFIYFFDRWVQGGLYTWIIQKRKKKEKWKHTQRETNKIKWKVKDALLLKDNPKHQSSLWKNDLLFPIDLPDHPKEEFLKTFFNCNFFLHYGMVNSCICSFHEHKNKHRGAIFRTLLSPC